MCFVIILSEASVFGVLLSRRLKYVSAAFILLIGHILTWMQHRQINSAHLGRRD